MSNEKIQSIVEEAANTEEFDIFEYIDNQPIGKDTHKVYVDVAGAIELRRLLAKRAEYLAEKRALDRQGKGEPLGLDEAFEDTEFDDDVNRLVEHLEKTAMTFNLRTVAPALRRAIVKKYEAKQDDNWDEEKKTEHRNKLNAEVMGKAIESVTLPDGRTDSKPWTATRVQKLETEIYEDDFQDLVAATLPMIHSGAVFEEVLTADFS